MIVLCILSGFPLQIPKHSQIKMYLHEKHHELMNLPVGQNNSFLFESRLYVLPHWQTFLLVLSKTFIFIFSENKT